MQLWSAAATPRAPTTAPPTPGQHTTRGGPQLVNTPTHRARCPALRTPLPRHGGHQYPMPHTRTRSNAATQPRSHTHAHTHAHTHTPGTHGHTGCMRACVRACVCACDAPVQAQQAHALVRHWMSRGRRGYQHPAQVAPDSFGCCRCVTHTHTHTHTHARATRTRRRASTHT